MDSTDNPQRDMLLIYKLVERDDGIQVTLSRAHRDFIRYIGSRGGELCMDWHLAEAMRATPPHLRRETIRQHMSKLVEMRLLDEIPVVGSDRSWLRLTDFGRNILTQLNDAN